MNQVAEVTSMASAATAPKRANNELHRLVYTSVRAAFCDDLAIEDIVATAREKNPPLSLTGALFHTKTRFLQVLEGPYDALMAQYEKITGDERHRGCHIRHCEPIRSRQFGDWGMGLTSLSDGAGSVSDTDRKVYEAMLSGEKEAFSERGMDVLKSFLLTTSEA